MELEELRRIHPLTVKEVTSVEDINARIIMRKFNNQSDFKFYYFLAAHFGGIYDKDNARFKTHYEYNPETSELKHARIRISNFISERSIIRSKGKIYFSGFYKYQVLSQIENFKTDNNGKC
ncbi:hypothetical protein [Dyadobacter sp. 3J3]|uniref:hypothetical protein n=1 Tax=Dyadobacter sp. 3J3 TaxID=2606600 RepID=UPI001358BD1E|nr:hypothetical protein [Dyadobacter sp. 3J3]